MIGIDTNVLVRYVLQDDAKQSHQATRFVEQECSIDSPGFINGVVLCEFVWVLETAYEYQREDIAKLLTMILRTRQFHVYQADIIWQSLNSYQKGLADFADNYIANLNHQNNCTYTVSFDKKAAKITHVKLLKTG